MVAFPSLYLVFMWVLASTTGRWVYGELDWTKPTSPGYYIGLVFLMLTAFGITFGLARLREYHHDAADALRRGKRGWAQSGGIGSSQVGAAQRTARAGSPRKPRLLSNPRPHPEVRVKRASKEGSRSP